MVVSLFKQVFIVCTSSRLQMRRHGTVISKDSLGPCRASVVFRAVITAKRHGTEVNSSDYFRVPYFRSPLCLSSSADLRTSTRGIDDTSSRSGFSDRVHRLVLRKCSTIPSRPAATALYRQSSAGLYRIACLAIRTSASKYAENA